MADRRRRKNISEAESEEDSRNEQTLDVSESGVSVNESEEGDQRRVRNKDEEEEGESEEEEEETDEEEEESEEEDEESYDEEDESVIIEGDDIDEERQSGDGEEQPDGGENVDDDEDKKNPAYVPKRGAFYEHDMRISMDEQEEDDKKPKKKLWKDEGKWQHDRFNESMQAPKTRAELYSIYGYDITRDNKPPEAPPRSNNRPRGPRSKQKSRFQDYIPEGEYIQNRNSYNSLKSGGRSDYEENGRGGRGYPRRRGDNYRRNNRYRNDNYYDNGNRSYGRSNRGDFNNKEDFPELGHREKPRRYEDERGYQNEGRHEQEYQSRGERSSYERENRSSREFRNSSERENRSHYNRDNSENVQQEKSGYDNRSVRDNRASGEQMASHKEERLSPEQEGRPYNEGYRRGRGSRGGRGNRRASNRKPEPERNFPPRFQRMKQNMAAGDTDQQGTGVREEGFSSPPVSPAEGKQGFPPPPAVREGQPQAAPVAESMIVQNVGEKKSYSKDRRVKSGRGPEEAPPAAVPEEAVQEETKQEEVIQSQQFDNKAYSKQEQGGKPKRYSSQRQRNMPEVGGYTEQPIEGQKFYPQDTVFIKGQENVLSNFNLSPMTWDKNKFSSAEHAYQFSKAIYHNMKELAEDMKKADTANKVKMLSKNVHTSEDWINKRCRIMKDILIEKFKQVEKFRTALLATGNKPLAHDVMDLFWGTGKNFKGQNMFGKLLMEVRDQARAQMSSQTSFSTHPTPAMLRPPIATVAFSMNAVPSGAISTPQHIFPGSQPATMTTQVQMIPPQYSNAGVLYAATPNYPVPPVPIAGFPPPANHPPALATHQQGYPSPPGTQQTSIAAQQSPTQAGQQDMFRNQTIYYPPELQMRGPQRAAPKRAKAAIPIVNPKEMKSNANNLEEGNVSQEELSQEQVLLEEQVPSEDKGGLEDHIESSRTGLSEESISQDFNNSNNVAVSEETSEMQGDTDLPVTTSDSEEKQKVKVEPDLVVDQENLRETESEITTEASVKSEDLQDKVEIKNEPVEVETEEATVNAPDEANVKSEVVTKDEENASDDESFTDAKDELEVEASASAPKSEESPST